MMSVEQLEEAYINDKVDLKFLDDCGSYFSSFVDVDEIIQGLAKIDDNSLTLFEVLDKFAEMDIIDDRQWLSGDADRATVRTIEQFYRVWVDVNAVAHRPDNILAADVNSAKDWKIGFHKALSKVILDYGLIVQILPTYYGWADYDLIGNKNVIGSPVAVFNVHEEYWHEFNGTFNTDDDSITGVSAEVVFDSGYSREMRLTESLSYYMNHIV